MQKFKRVFVSSKDMRSGGSIASFTVPFNEPIKHVTAIGVEDIVLPNTLWNVLAGKNDEIRFDQGGIQTVNLTPGHYDPDTLLVELNDQLGSFGFVFTKDDDSRTFVASCTTDATLLDCTAIDLLGFNVGMVATVVALPSGSRWATPVNKSWNLRSSVKSLFLIGDNMSIMGTTSNRDRSSRELPILTKIPISVDASKMINYDRVLAPHHFITLKEKGDQAHTIPSALSFRILDDEGNLAPLSDNTEISFTLVLRL